MINDRIAKSMVTSAVHKGIRDIQYDSGRAIRKLVDLGLYFSKGDAQKDFFTMTQDILSNESSSYYMFITDLVNKVNTKNLQTIGVDVGYMSWSFGTKRIRKFEEHHGHLVPWTIFIDVSSDSKEAFPLNRIISEGQHIGIYTYFISIGNNEDSFVNVYNAAKKNPDSAFLLLAKTEYAAELICREDTLPLNIMPVLDCTHKRFQQYNRLLADKHILKGVYKYYNDDNYQNILNGEVSEELISGGNNIIFFIAENDCSKKTSDIIYDYVVKVRNEQVYPAFFMDLFNDVAYADRTISESACTLDIHPDGSVTTCSSENSDINISKLSLTEAMNELMPRIGA